MAHMSFQANPAGEFIKQFLNAVRLVTWNKRMRGGLLDTAYSFVRLRELLASFSGERFVGFQWRWRDSTKWNIQDEIGVILRRPPLSISIP